MSFLLFAITGLHVLILVLLFVATLDKVRRQAENPGILASTTSPHSPPRWLHAVQALMVLALLFSSFAFVLFMYQLYTMERGGLFYATGVCQLLACLSVFTAALIYAIHVGEFHQHRQRGGSFGYCFVLAWLAFPLALLSGIMYIHLRKRE
uniref:Epithelial membrane protein 3 n=1 Tax=Chelydra serpentina TaxID=8475 RepID=A0A8C3T257_CHESE